MASSTRSTHNSSKSVPLIAINSLVFDNSGSTESMGDAPVEQIHELMTKLKEDSIKNNSNIRVSLHTFNTTIRQVIPSDPSQLSVDMREFEVPSLHEFREILRPGGMTALYDAGIIGFNHIDKIYNEEFSKLPKNVQKLNPYISKCYVLSTDGLDNQSEHSISDFKKATLKAKENNVQPLFLFANIDSEMGKQMGFKKTNTAKFNPTYSGVTSMLRATTQALRQVSSGQTQTINSQQLTQDMSPVTSPNSSPRNSSSPPPLLRTYAQDHTNYYPIGLSPPTLRRY